MPLTVDALLRGYRRGRMLMLCLLLGLVIYVGVTAALDGIWVIAGLCAMMSLLIPQCSGRPLDRRSTSDNETHEPS